MRARWADARKAEGGPVSPAAPPRPQNVRAILDLGNMIYFEFRGRAYGVPPLPWREGERLLDDWLLLRGLGDTVERAKLSQYFGSLRRMAKVMWRNTRPIGHVLRLAKALRILRNPFLDASESEIAELAVFFLGLRTRSTASFRAGPDALQT